MYWLSLLFLPRSHLKQENEIEVSINIAYHVSLFKNIEDHRNAGVHVGGSLPVSVDAVLFVNNDILHSYLVVGLEVLNVFSLVLAMLQFEEKGWQLVDNNINHES